MNNRTRFSGLGRIWTQVSQFALFGLLTVARPCLAASFQDANVEQGSSRACVDSRTPTTLSEVRAIQQTLLTERQPVTLFTLMPARYQQLRRALEGFQRTGVPLVAFDGNSFYGAGFSDDLGEYYLIPKLASFLDLRLPTAVDVFLGTILCVSFLAGLVGFFFLFRHGPSRTVALIGLFLLFLGTFREGDVYILLSSTTVALVPWLLYFVQRGVADGWFATFASGAGLCAGFANLIRSHSGTGFMLFMAIAVLFALRCRWRSRILLIAVAVAACAAPSLYFRSLRDRRDAYLNGVQPSRALIQEQHPFWHSVYIGFGFLSNEMVPAYSDEVAVNKVAAISPDAHYLSAEYEEVLKNQVFFLIRHHFSFVVLTLAAKVGVICFALLLCGNVGLLAAALYPKTWPIEAAFWVAIAFSSLSGLLVIPYPKYLLGFMAFATLYAVVSVDHALEARDNRQAEELPARWLRRTACAG
jgi:hypothetical protein